MLGLTLSGSCRAPDPHGDPSPVAGGTRYALVFLVTGPREAELSPDEVRVASLGHQANIRRLGEEGALLLAGPFGPAKADPTWRGIFVFDEPDLEAARALTRSDPAVAAGAFEMLVFPWTSPSPLRELHARTRERLDAGEEFVGRAYVLGIAAPAAEARAALADLELAGRLALVGELGGERAGELLFAVVADDLDATRAELEALAPAVDWSLSAWYASAILEELAAGG